MRALRITRSSLPRRKREGSWLDYSVLHDITGVDAYHGLMMDEAIRGRYSTKGCSLRLTLSFLASVAFRGAGITGVTDYFMGNHEHLERQPWCKEAVKLRERNLNCLSKLYDVIHYDNYLARLRQQRAARRVSTL